MSGWIGNRLRGLELGIEHFRNTAAIEELQGMDGNRAFQALRDRVAALDESAYHSFMLALKAMIDAEQQRLLGTSTGDCADAMQPTGFGTARSRERADLGPGRLLTLQAFRTYASHYRRQLVEAASGSGHAGGAPITYA